MQSLLVVVLWRYVAAVGTAMQLGSTGSPVKRVVFLLRKMEDKVEEEGKVEKEMFEKFQCYYKTHSKNLADAIQKDTTSIPKLQSKIKADSSVQTALSSDIKKAKEDRDTVNKAMSEGTALRKKEEAEYKKDSAELKASIDAVGRSIKVLKKGGIGSDFLQTEAGGTLHKLVDVGDLNNNDRDLLSSFISEATSGDLAEYDEETGSSSGKKSSDEVVGILAVIEQNMKAQAEDTDSEEAQKRQEFAVMSKAKESQKRSLSRQIEAKTVRVGEVAVELVEKREELDDVNEQLEKNKELQKQLVQEAQLKNSMQEEMDRMRSQELIAIGDAIKILVDDDARELIKANTDSAASSFLQLRARARVQSTAKYTKDVRKEALHVLREAKKNRGAGGDPRLDLLSLALRSKKANLDKVIDSITKMTDLMGKEQDTDDRKKESCLKELSKAKFEVKNAHADISDLSKAIEEGTDKVKALGEDVAGMTKTIQDLDTMVVEAGQQRKDEHKEFVEVSVSNGLAKQLLRKAKHRILKFYNRRLAEAKVALLQEDEELNLGDDQPAQEEYKKKGEAAGGVVDLIGSIILDLDKETKAMEVEEKNSQRNYEDSMEGARTKRATDASAAEQIEAVKAEIQAKLHKWEHTSLSIKKETREMELYLADLHKDCDWLLEKYDVRKDNRAEESKSLFKAQSILSGADYSFLQLASGHGEGLSKAEQGTRRHFLRSAR